MEKASLKLRSTFKRLHANTQEGCSLYIRGREYLIFQQLISQFSTSWMQYTKEAKSIRLGRKIRWGGQFLMYCCFLERLRFPLLALDM